MRLLPPLSHFPWAIIAGLSERPMITTGLGHKGKSISARGSGGRARCCVYTDVHICVFFFFLPPDSWRGDVCNTRLHKYLHGRGQLPFYNYIHTIISRMCQSGLFCYPALPVPYTIFSAVYWYAQRYVQQCFSTVLLFFVGHIYLSESVEDRCVRAGNLIDFSRPVKVFQEKRAVFTKRIIWASTLRLFSGDISTLL